jgi:hypothetical protein
MSAAPVDEAILDVLEGKTTSSSYLSSAAPGAASGALMKIGGMSPVNILATDNEGNETGIVPVPGTSDIYFAKHDIPGSAVGRSGEEKFIYLPQGQSYSISITGYDSGPANIQIQNIDAEGNITQTTTVADIPVTATSTGSFTISSENSISPIVLDVSGGSTTIVPQTGTTTEYSAPATPAPQASSGSIAIPNVVHTAPTPPAFSSTTSTVATTSQKVATTTVSTSSPPASSGQATSTVAVQRKSLPHIAAQPRSKSIQLKVVSPAIPAFSQTAAAYPAASPWLVSALSFLLRSFARFF